MLTKELLTPYSLGHLGLVGAYNQEAGIIEKIDSRLPQASSTSGHLTHGQIVALMILNVLGYTTRPLHMAHNFFEAKDVAAMLGIEFQSAWLNDDVIDRTMDDLYNYGLTPLLSQISSDILQDLGCKAESVGVDSISFHYQGSGQKSTDDGCQEEGETDAYCFEPHKISVICGSKPDADPELDQIMEQMVIDKATGIPLFMELENGTSGDRKASGRMEQVFKNFRKQSGDGYAYLSGDPALYSEENIVSMEEAGIRFITRVAPGKSKSTKKFIEDHRDDELEPIDDVNQGKIYKVEDCGVQQIWLLVQSNAIKKRRFFIVATNDLQREWQPQELLSLCQSHDNVERGFRFLKFPDFFADPVFVSQSERVQTLFMLMSLGLAVFSALDWKLRHAMKERKVKLKNQVGKLTDRITMRFVFQIFSPVITVNLESGERLVYHVSPEAQQILELLGDKYQAIYV